MAYIFCQFARGKNWKKDKSNGPWNVNALTTNVTVERNVVNILRKLELL